VPPKKAKVPGPPPKEAIEYFEAKGMKPSFDYTDVWKEEHSAAFTVAKVMEHDVLETIRQHVDAALKDGTTFRKFREDLAATMDRSGWSDYNKGRSKIHRMRVIYDTNMRVARSSGQWQRIDRTKDLLPYLVYSLGPSIRHRPHHEAWAGTTLPADHPWWDDHMVPNGWLCKCWVQQVSRREAERRGISDDSPPSPKVRWVNKKTGKVEMIPEGIDPGWNYNPGKNRMLGPETAEKEAGL
jgi:uncharacterized protein with gpF-like domain